MNNNHMRMMNGNDGQDRNIIEDTPRMRSMAVKPLTPTLLMPPAPLSAKSRSTVPRTSNKPLNHEGKDSTLNVGTLKPIPEIYVVERTHVFVNDSTQNIANRIAECLRTGSMAASYQKEEVSPRATKFGVHDLF